MKADIDSGAQLIDVLDDGEFGITTAFWMFNDDAHLWFLYLATRLVDQEDTTELYRRLGETAQAAGVGSGALSDVKLASPKDPVVRQAASQLARSGMRERVSVDNPQWFGSMATATGSSEDWLIYKSS